MKLYVKASKENKLLPYIGQDIWIKVHHSNTYAYIRLLAQDGNNFLYNKLIPDYRWKNGKYTCSQAMQERILTTKYHSTPFFWTPTNPIKTKTTEEIFDITDPEIVESSPNPLDDYVGVKDTWVKCTLTYNGYKHNAWVRILSEKNGQYVYQDVATDAAISSPYDLDQIFKHVGSEPKNAFKICTPIQTLTTSELKSKVRNRGKNADAKVLKQSYDEFKKKYNLVSYGDSLDILKQYEGSNSFILTYFKDSLYDSYPVDKKWVQIVKINSRNCIYTIWDGKHWTYKETSPIKFMFLPKDIQIKTGDELLK